MRKRNRVPGLYRRESGNFYIQRQFTVAGKLVKLSESTGTASIEEAQRYLEMRLTQEREAVLYGKARRMTLLEAADRMLEESQHLKSVDRYEGNFKNLLPELGGLYLDEIHDGTVQPYVKKRLAQGVSHLTVNHEIGVIVRCLRLAARKWRDDAGNPYLASEIPLITRAKGSKRAPYPLNHDEQERLMKELPDHLRAAVLFGLQTGARQKVITDLKWSFEVVVPELNVSCFVIPAQLSKNGKEHVVVLNSIARKIVEGQRGKHPEYVFTFRGQKMSRINNTAWRNAVRRANLPIRFHDIRHTVGHRLRAVGAPEQDVATLLHHTTSSITTHYSAAELGILLDWSEKLVSSRPSTVLRTGWSERFLPFSDQSSEELHSAH